MKRIKLCLLSILVYTQLHTVRAVIFDLNGVLFTTNTGVSLWRLGPTRLAYYRFFYGKSPYHLKTKLYEILNDLGPLEDTPISYDDAGIPMPPLMQQWLTGAVDGQWVLEAIAAYIARHDMVYTNTLENALINSLAQIIFDPTTFTATRSVIWEGVCFALKCKKAGLQIYILSNWDAQSFKILYEHYHAIFDQFDGVVISGTQQTMKPLPTLFYRLLNLYALKPQDCIFIDDQQENIDTAASLGFKTIVCPTTGYPLKTPDFAAVKQQYENYLFTQTASGHESIV